MNVPASIDGGMGRMRMNTSSICSLFGFGPDCLGI